MPASSLLVLIDDIAAILDDVAAMSKIAAKKTAGVLGDDLALNAEQVSGVRTERELPVVWAVAKGSLVNKAILVPLALLISTVIPWAVMPLLMVGGAYLCFEGSEKLLPGSHGDHAGGPSGPHPQSSTTGMGMVPAAGAAHPALDPEEIHSEKIDPEKIDLEKIEPENIEKEKIRGAIRTDFVLSAEIIVISLGTVSLAPFLTKLSVLTVIALVMTVGVYGLVAGIVKLDDAGFYLVGRSGESLSCRGQRAVGRFLLRLAPVLMKGLAVVGTAAMFLVGGGIVAHGIPWVQEVAHALSREVETLQGVGWLLAAALPQLVNALTGVVVGFALVGVVHLVGRIRGK
ncbi:MAG: DUF808 domain-containing protein [Magnetococcales bacterium]|nr:DUF808 domain-containing protein [Magnetococcales bacterium]